MSIRTEPAAVNQSMGALDLNAGAAQPSAPQPANVGEAAAENHLAEASTFNTTNPEHPLSRSVVVSIRASLNDLCLVSCCPTLYGCTVY